MEEFDFFAATSSVDMDKRTDQKALVIDLDIRENYKRYQ